MECDRSWVKNMTHLRLLLIVLLQLTIDLVSTIDNNNTSQSTIPKSVQLSPPFNKAQDVLPPAVTKTLIQEKLCNSSPNFDASLFDQ